MSKYIGKGWEVNLCLSGETDVRTNGILVVTMIVAGATAAGLYALKRGQSAGLKPPTVLFMCPHGAAKSLFREHVRRDAAQIVEGVDQSLVVNLARFLEASGL